MGSSERIGLDFIGGVALGGVAGVLIYQFFADPDEERPPILVRNGSLTFTSEGDRRKSWEKVEKDKKGRWKQKHPKGKTVEWLVVERLVQGKRTVWLTKAITIRYDGKTFSVGIEAPESDKKRQSLSIDGPDLEIRDEASEGYILGYPNGLNLEATVTFTTWTEDDITWTDREEFTIWQL